MKRSWTLFLLLCVAGCGPMGVDSFSSLFGNQPRVVAVQPGDGAEVSPDAMVAVAFSQPVDPRTVGTATLAVVALAGDNQELDAVAADVAAGNQAGVDGTYELQDEARAAIFHPAAPFTPGMRYAVIATGGILNEDALPLNQRPGKTPAPFISSFLVSAGTGGEANGDASSASASGGAGGSGGGGAGSSGGGTAATPRVRPETLIINELLYDAVGVDTNGDVFVELVGDAGSDISGYKVVFVRGSDGVLSATITLPDGAKIGDDGIYLIADAVTGQEGTSHVAGADYIKNFDPQNGPDCVQLLDDSGRLLDALGYGSPIVPLAANGMACLEGTSAKKVSSGQSLSRTAGTDTGDNAADFKALAVPTPGAL